MAEDAKRTGPGTNDTTEYSPSKAPETRTHAEEKETVADWRLIPGGRDGVHADPGMAGLDRDSVPSGATDEGLQDFSAVDD
jgi:hypothetical protein